MATTSSSGPVRSDVRVGRRRPTKGDRREQAILDGAYELLRDTPLRTVSIDDLAKRAGLSRSSFYFYFESKWQVLFAMLGPITEDVFGASRLIFDRPVDMTPQEAIEQASAEVVTVWHRHGHILREVGDAVGAEPELRSQWDSMLGQFIEAAAAAIERDRAAGVAIDGPPARSLAAALMWMGERNLGLMSMRSENAFRSEDAVETMATVWLRTIFGVGTRAQEKADTVTR
ncbi:TetR/AcrR family transcriptional regulator [Pseudonocardia sp. KRD291]|uniref:TetR/AcrR family transcriptional regulator n=1 Tax=Pseudonocardia sp. KRD291 TaxID=2792007 RepID=UPI001C4A69D9|nr:TetR/AcrR family transcriptional regulator [Pseudonocardia sp. KRD291]MBW0105376.1 TetR/AcrR family transcriptional regulator [Pseudonocardia sp. KRD291]